MEVEVDNVFFACDGCSAMWCGAGVGTCDGNSIVDLANEATIDACLGMK